LILLWSKKIFLLFLLKMLFFSP